MREYVISRCNALSGLLDEIGNEIDAFRASVVGKGSMTPYEAIQLKLLEEKMVDILGDVVQLEFVERFHNGGDI